MSRLPITGMRRGTLVFAALSTHSIAMREIMKRTVKQIRKSVAKDSALARRTGNVDNWEFYISIGEVELLLDSISANGEAAKPKFEAEPKFEANSLLDEIQSHLSDIGKKTSMIGKLRRHLNEIGELEKFDKALKKTPTLKDE